MKGIYAGSFDPPTKGHEWMIHQGAEMFDEFQVAVALNTGKTPIFSLDERMKMLSDLTFNISNVSVVELPSLEYLARYSSNKGIKYLLRGVRDIKDLEYEYKMRQINERIEPSCKSIFLMPPRDLALVSSSLIKDLIGPNGWEEIVKDYVPENVYRKLMEKYNNGGK